MSGPLDFDATINQGEFNRSMDQMKQRIKGVGDHAVKEGDRMENAFKGAAIAAAAYFSFDFAKKAAFQIGQVRGEFQTLEIAFESLLKKKDLSDKLMKDIIKFAAVTPFGLQEVATGAKQLLAYGTNVKNIIPTLTRLGDVASGLSISFEDLVRLYGTSAVRGEVMSKNLIQFANKGIPVIQELMKIYDLAEEKDVFELASKGVLHFKDLEDVFYNLTEAGGMFSGMMIKQSDSILGLKGNLEDAWDVMLNNLGEANQGIYEDSLALAGKLVENYQTIIDILKVIIATYGAYRAAILLNSIAINGYSKALGLATIKQNLLNLAQKASPWGLALAGITALVGGLWAYNRAVDDTGKKLAAFNDTINESVGEAEALFDAVKRSTAGTEERKQAIERLQSKYPDYLKNINLEKAGLQEIETAQKRVSDQIIKRMALEQAEVEKAELYKNKLAIIKLINEEGVDYNDILAKRKQDEDTFLATGRNTMTFYGDTVDAYLRNIYALDQQINEVDKTYGNIAKNIAKNISNSLAEFEIETVEEQLTVTKKIASLRKEIAEQQKQLQQLKSPESIYDSGKIKETEDSLSALKKELESIIGASEEVDKKSFSDTISEIKQTYENYYRWVENYGKESADQQFKNLVSGGKSFLEYLNAEISKYEGKSKKSNQDVDNLGVLLASKDDLLGNETQIEAFKKQIEEAKDGYKSLVDYISFLKETIDAQGDWDGSEQEFEKLNFLYAELAKSNKQYVKDSRDTYDQLLKATANFAKRRLEIEVEFNETVKKLDPNSLTEEQYAEALAAARKLKNDKLDIIQEEETRSTDAYKRIAKELNSLTKKEALDYLKTLKAQLKELGIQRNLYEELAELIENTEQAIKDEELEKLRKISDAFREASQFASLFNEELGSIINTISQVVEGIAKMASGNLVSGGFQIATSILSAAINASDNAAKKAEERQQRILDNLAERLSNINELLARQIKLIDSLTGTDKLGGYSLAFKKLKNDISDTLNQLEQMNVMASSLDGRNHYGVALDEYIKTYNEIFGDNNGGRNGGSQEVSLDVIQRLINENKEATNQLYERLLDGDYYGNEAEQVQMMLDQLELQTQEFEDLKNEYNEYLTGTSLGNVVDSIVSGFSEGKKSAKDFAENFEKLMKDAMLQSLKMKSLEKPLADWYEDFAKMSEDGLTSTELEDLRRSYDYILSNASEQWEELQGILNDGNELQSDTSLTGAIKGVSQETAGLIAGQMNAIRMNQAHSLVSLNNMLEKLSGIEHNTRNNAYIKSIYEFLQTNSDNGSNNIRANGGY